jgi:ferredoxin
MPEQAGRYIIDFTDIPAARQRMPELEVAARIQSFDEVEVGFSREAAQQEARRCLSCRRCLGCGLCLAVCKPRAIVFEQQDDIMDITFDDVVISSTADEQMPIKKGEFGYRQHANVVSGLEFEKILSNDGPYNGMVLRPFDGRIPQKIAFILASAEASDSMEYVMNQAALLLEKVKDAEIFVFCPEGLCAAAPSGTHITLKKAAVSGVNEDATSGNIRIAYTEKDSEQEENFCMVVVVRPPEPSRAIQELCSKFGRKPLKI